MGRFIWIASYPKSGSTWLRAFLNNYIRDLQVPYALNSAVDISTGESGASLYHPLDPRPASHYSIADVQRMRPLVHRRLAAAHDGLFFVKTHNALLSVENTSLITPDVTAGAIYLVRDPRDIAVSYSFHLGLSLDRTIAFMADGDAATGGTDVKVYERLSSWSAHVHFWTRAPNPRLHVMRYEDVVDSPEAQFGALIRFLGRVPDPARLRRAVAFSAFPALAAQEQAHGFDERPAESQAAFFRSGKPGQWRRVLSAGQAAQLARQQDGVMRRFGYV